MQRQMTPVIAVVVMLGGLVGLAVYLKRELSTAVAPETVDSQLDSSGKIRPLADVITQTRGSRLVTVQIASNVTVLVEDRSWRGNASASLSAPVRYSYGVDLSQLDQSCFAFSELTSTYSVKIPKPTRIATEVDTAKTFDEHVEVGLGRMRGRAGETQLSLARKKLSEEAERQALSPADTERVEKNTLESVRDLVQRIVGAAKVEVSYR
jgi:hypothetical protein